MPDQALGLDLDHELLEIGARLQLLAMSILPIR